MVSIKKKFLLAYYIEFCYHTIGGFMGRHTRYGPRLPEETQYEHYRRLVLEHYGKSCECCGESRTPFLAIDHLPGTVRSKTAKHLTHWLLANGFPEGYRTLCHNCNMAIRWGKICPHKQWGFVFNNLGAGGCKWSPENTIFRKIHWGFCNYCEFRPV